MGLTRPDKDFINAFMDLIIQEESEQALIEAFFQRWNPHRLYISLQKRLRKFEKKKVRNAVSRGLRREVIEAVDEHRCCYCGQPVVPGKFQVDHCVSYEKGGTTDFKNLVTACDVCNRKKGLKSYQDKLPDIERKRKDFIYDTVADAWMSKEGRIALRRLFLIVGRYE